MTKEELTERRDKLLQGQGKDLHDAITKMIETKHMLATCDAITCISGRGGRDEIVITLFIDVPSYARPVPLYLYLTEDIFDIDGFCSADGKIGPKSKDVDIDTLIKLRALRTVFDAIKTISNASITTLNYRRPIFARTADDGEP